MHTVIEFKDIKPGQHWLTVQKLGSGWAVIEYWMNNERTEVPEDFPEPWTTGISRYATEAEAMVEAHQWSNNMQLPFMNSIDV